MDSKDGFTGLNPRALVEPIPAFAGIRYYFAGIGCYRVGVRFIAHSFPVLVCVFAHALAGSRCKGGLHFKATAMLSLVLLIWWHGTDFCQGLFKLPAFSSGGALLQITVRHQRGQLFRDGLGRELIDHAFL